MKKTIIFTGGGTGGHVFPGLAVAERLQGNPDISLCWAGSRNGMERSIVERHGIPYYPIPAGKLRRYFSVKNFFDAFSVLTGIIHSIFLLKRLKADYVFSQGGFVSVPPVIAARILGIPAVTHESDFDPGLATRINARFCSGIFTAYEETKQFFPSREQKKILVTGNPVRRAILAGKAERGRDLIPIPEGKKVLLAMGGSQGAREINSWVETMKDRLAEICFVVHQTGREDYREVREESYFSAPFFSDEYPDILAAADLVISRAGAGTLWENGITGKPMVLIPLGGKSSRGDQIKNADYFVSRNAAEKYAMEGRGGEKLFERVMYLLGAEEERKKLGANALAVCNPDSAARITDIILQELFAISGMPGKEIS